MQINIAICDDEKAEIDYLSLLLKKWAESSNVTIRISSFYNAENFLFQYTDNKDFDIILLDIQMGGLSGIDLAKKLRKENNTVQIIFISGFTDFIAEGYEVSALHYLVKPVNEDKFFNVLDKAVESIKHVEKSLFITTDGEMHRIMLSEIRYAEAQGHYVVIKTISGEYRMKINLSDLEKTLGEGFFRCQRSFIVNLLYIKKITRNAIILDDLTEIPLSRNLYNEANRAVIDFFP